MKKGEMLSFNYKKKSCKNLKKVVLVLLFSISVLLVSCLVMSEDITSSGEDIIGIKIVDFDSPIKLGEFSEFTYLIEANFEKIEDILINFQVEKDGEIISSGSDTSLIKKGEILEKTKIFLPSSLESGIYTLNIKANYNNHEVKSFRVIEVRVKGTSAIINPGNGEFKSYFMISLIVLFILVLFLLIYLERKKIDEVLIKEQKFIKKHRGVILAFILILILAILFYFFDLYYYLPNIPLYSYIIIGAIIVLLLIKFAIRKKRK